MKVIIDPYRGGKDTGELINGQYEKNILLNISKTLQKELEIQGIKAILTRENDISLTDDERNSIINELKEQDDIIIQNRTSSGTDFDIIYPLRNNDNLPSHIANTLNNSNIIIDNYYQRRLPTNTMLDYYSVIRNTNPNETIIIEYPKELESNKKIIEQIALSIKQYINKKNTYIVQKGDTLYKIAQKHNTTVEELKKINNLTNDKISIGLVLKLPLVEASSKNTETYIVKKGDTLYKISTNYNIPIQELKKLNNLQNDNLSIGQKIKIPDNNKQYLNYIVKKGDTLYQIAQKYNVSVADIKLLNNLTTNILTIGQNIKISR